MVNELECGVPYTLIARGTLNGELIGPNKSHGSFPTCACPIDVLGGFV